MNMRAVEVEEFHRRTSRFIRFVEMHDHGVSRDSAAMSDACMIYVRIHTSYRRRIISG
jgi:hypothetical protein